MITAKCRGHLIVSGGTDWTYEDGVPFDDSRACIKCNIMHEKDGPDPCLGMLDGVDFACCGHGDPLYEYVKAGTVRYDSVEEWSKSV